MRIFRISKLVSLIYFRRVWRLNPQNNTIYLTFDDGPHPDITPFVLDELKKHRIKATFFCVGDNVIKYPAIYSRILQEGHQVGNHTFRHENALKVKWGRYLSSIQNTASYVHSNLFRPPYGRLSLFLGFTIAKKYKIIQWTWLSYDFDEKVNVSEILTKAAKIKAGDILVLHDNPKISDKQKVLLPQLLEMLQKRGFQFDKIKT